MKIRAVLRLVPMAIATIGIGGFFITPLDAVQDPAASSTPQPRKGIVIRGCLTGSKLTHVDPQTQLPADLLLNLPGTLKVTSIRVIRDQVKALNGHLVEVTGALSGIPGIERGLLVVDSENGKLYLGGDPKMGSDTSVTRNEPPTIHAQMIKDVGETCLSQPK